MPPTLYTIGHSTRPIDELLEILHAAGVRVLYDVRRYPGSRRNPQYSKQALSKSIVSSGLRYVHVEALGGRRSTTAASPNTAWENPQFRGYADWTASNEFQRAFDDLLEVAERDPTAVMCAEALPHRCHRRLIADAAVLRGWAVTHLLAPARSEPHRLHPDARLAEDGRGIVYPSAQASL